MLFLYYEKTIETTNKKVGNTQLSTIIAILNPVL